MQALKSEPALNSILENSNGPESIQQEKKESDTKELENNENSEILPEKKSTVASLVIAISFPVLVFFLHFLCQENDCSIQNWTLPNLSKLATLYDPMPIIFVGGFYVGIILLSLLPFGEIINSDSYVVAYRRNGLITAIGIFLPAAFAKHYFQFQVSPFIPYIPKLVLPVMIFSLIFGLLILFINRRSDTENGIISKFLLGTSSDVSLAGLSVKSILNRISAITLIAINYVLIEADFEQNKTLSPTLLLITSMQIIYSFNHILDEMENLHTVTAGRLNVGWALLSNTLMYPFFVSLITLYNTTHRFVP